VSFLRLQRRDRGSEAGRDPAGRQHGHPPIDHPDIREFIECKLDGGIVNSTSRWRRPTVHGTPSRRVRSTS
jgi:hypothetical protein